MSGRAATVAFLLACSSPCALSRALHLEHFKISPVLDAEKFLAAQNDGGWANVGDQVVGQIEDRWLGAFSTKNLRPTWIQKLDSDLSLPSRLSTNGTLLIGTRKGEVGRIEAVTGRTLWTASLDSFPVRGFVEVEALVYVMSAREQLYALAGDSGKAKWVYDSASTSQMTIQNGALPLVNQAYVFMPSSNGDVKAIDLETGKLAWTYSTAQPSTSRFHDVVGEMALHDGKLIYSRADGIIEGIDLAKQNARWQQVIPNEVTESAYRNGRFFVGTGLGELLCLDAEDGKTFWRTQLAGSINSIATGEKKLYVSSSLGGVFALDSFDGTLLWSDDLAAPISNRSIVYLNHNPYFVTANGNFYGYLK